MTRTDFIHRIAASVRDAGAVATLDDLRAARPTMFDTDGTEIAYHDTFAVFTVWAVDRLVAAGLTDAGILWHPLIDVASPLAWWDAETLTSPTAAANFVASTKVLPGEPAPAVPSAVLAAA